MICQLLKWDTEFFDQRIGRANIHRLDVEATRAVLAWCHEHQIDCLYFLADSDDPLTVRLAEANQFHLVDLRVTVSAALDKLPWAHNTTPGLSIAPVAAAEVAALRALAAISHYDSRFYADRGFPTAKVDALYERWIEQSCQDEAQVVLVAHWQGQVAGYLACACDNAETGRMSLMAVVPGLQGQGIGRALVESGFDWFRKQQVQAVVIVTQGRNIRALRMYERFGFTIQNLQLWYHRWFSPAQAMA
jgi:dTDP-4-amino-4,6-dideoxy-D-galactose acyltransferase